MIDKKVTIEVTPELFAKIDIVIQACYQFGGTLINLPDGQQVPLAEIGVDLKRELQAQIQPQIKQS